MLRELHSAGGTAAGLALGLHWSGMGGELVGLGVDDSPEEFYDRLDSIFRSAHIRPPIRRDRMCLIAYPEVFNSRARVDLTADPGSS